MESTSEKLSQNQRQGSDDEYIPEIGEDIPVDEELEDEYSNQHELSRMRSLKLSQSNYMKEIRASGKKTKRGKPDIDPQEKMKDLITQAEKLASFLLSKHKMHAADPRDKNQIKRKKTKSVGKEDIDVLRADSEEDEINQDYEFIRLTRQPNLIKGGTLKGYQMIGLNWLISLYEIGINGILADEMGLGKTIQTIAFLAFLKEMKGISGPHLIVGPNSIVGNWCKELAKWCPSLRVVKLYARKEYREEIFEKQLIKGKFDVCVTSYEGINICLSKLKKFRWRYIIIDEAHRLKNEMSVLSKNLRLFKTDLKLLITGTPLQNNLHELWSLLNFLLPELFDDSEIFDNWFSLNENNTELERSETEKKNVKIINSLHRILRPFILRRTKENMAKSLPKKQEIQLYVGLSQVQVEIYKNILMRKSTGRDKKFYMNVLMQLRKACNHPYLFEGIEAEDAPILGHHLVDVSGKLRVLDKLLTRLHGGHQVLIFSQMTSMLNILEDYCRYRGFNYCRIDGETMIEDRERQIEEFTNKDSTLYIFLLSTRAGGLGINLATADTVVLYDSDWNPQVDLQAMDRAHRIGQVNPVNVYRFITENTIEEKIIERQLIKLKWDCLVIQKGRLAQKNKGMNKIELQELINHGASEIFKATEGTISEEDIDNLLKRGKERMKTTSSEVDDALGEKAKNISDLGVTSINVYEFEGDDYQKKKKEDRIAVAKAQIVEAKIKLHTRRAGKTDYFAIEKKVVRIPEYHLYENRKKLIELLNKENDLRYNAMVMRERREIVPESFEQLNDEEEEEKSKLLQSGLTHWTKNDFQAFIRGNELFSRTRFDLITKKVKTKSLEDVKIYSERFWRLIDDFEEAERFKSVITKGEEAIQLKQKSSVVISEKCVGCEHYDELTFNFQVYNKFRSRLFTLDHDKFLLFASAKFGYGSWKKIRAAMKIEDSFEFDHYFKSRSDGDLNKRMNSLLKVVKAELNYPKEKYQNLCLKMSLDLEKRSRILRFGEEQERKRESRLRKANGSKRSRPSGGSKGGGSKGGGSKGGGSKKKPKQPPKTPEQLEAIAKTELAKDKLEQGKCLNLEKRAPERASEEEKPALKTTLLDFISPKPEKKLKKAPELIPEKVEGLIPMKEEAKSSENGVDPKITEEPPTGQ